jgi:hypothetical protein
LEANATIGFDFLLSLYKTLITMKNYLFPVYLVTAVLIVYVTAIQVNLATSLILFVFSFSPALVIWMVYRVLTADVEVTSTFEEKWYEDQ